MPHDVNEAFSVSFVFDTTAKTDDTSNPNGFTPPWSSGVKSTKFYWGINPVPALPNGKWIGQYSDPLVVGGVTPKPNQYKAAGNPFTVNIVGSNPASVISNAQIQVAAFTTADDTRDTTRNYIDAPFSGYCWDLWKGDDSTLSPIPARNGKATAFSTSTNYTLSYRGDDGTTPLFPIISFVFKDNLRGLVARQGKIFIDVAVYLTLDGVNCFDDPEMEIDLGSN